MEGVVIKLEAATNNSYSDDRYVIGTNVTVKHGVEGRKKDEVVRVNSTVFMPPNSVLPYIGDLVEVSVYGAPEISALPPEGFEVGDFEVEDDEDDEG